MRENWLPELPSAHMYVGRTSLSVDDIRAWNDHHRREYELHVNDCRHYVNSLVKYTTGECLGQAGRGGGGPAPKTQKEV